MSDTSVAKKGPKIVFATIPLRDYSTHLPIASLSIMTALKRRGYTNTKLFEINILRPPYAEVLEYFKREKPDIVGLSAVVSTSYAVVKQLAADLRKMNPDVLIVCGGNLVANANVLLAKTEIDICCTGEGEVTMCEIVDHYVAGTMSPEELRRIHGIAFNDEKGEMVITCYAEQIDERDIFEVDWDIADETPGIERCISPDLPHHYVVMKDIRYYQPHRRGKKIGRFYASKGCVARCTFCHRFTKGIRYVPVDLIEKRLREYIDRYDIGFVYFTDENFGTHDAWLKPFCAMIKKFDLLWGVGGIRVNRIDPAKLKMMYDAGCSSVAYGTETGSEKMLQVMEKAVTLADNYKILKLTPQANLYFAPQMVIGMPGETEETIEETARFLEAAFSEDAFYHPADVQINYAQALPGTPLYESARVKALVEPTVDGEEAYLFKVSDKNARDIDATVNHTETPHLVWKAWGQRLRACANYAYVKKFGYEAFMLRHEVLNRRFSNTVRDEQGESFYVDADEALKVQGTFEDVKAAIRKMDAEYRSGRRKGVPFKNRLLKYPRLVYHLRGLMPVYVGLKEFKTQGAGPACAHFAEYFGYLARKLLRLGPAARPKLDASVSLRKAVKERSEQLDALPEMTALRAGR